MDNDICTKFGGKMHYGHTETRRPREQQKTQLSQRDRSMLRVIEYFA